jgi:alkanesulfonate monooxygenase SsuD/methylene tetrahydromethanopterin reductase-like flavin-dependent oxidoreductase (luciferase family)
VPQFNHPIRIAERAAVLDILSGGRLEMGTGRSATWTELGGFEANPDDTKKTWDEFVHAIPKMWTQERYRHEGQFFSMPSRAVLPKPVQKPHPPLWVAVSTPGTEDDAADRGMGCLGVNFTSFAEQERKVKEYRRRIQWCDPVGAFVNDQLNTVNFLYCHDDSETGVMTGRRMISKFQYMAGQLDMAKEVYPTRAYLSAGLLAGARRQAAAPGDLKEPPEGIAIGNPDQIVRELKKWEETGVDRCSFMLNAAEDIPHEQVMESLRLFATEVMPHFVDDSAAEASRAEARRAAATGVAAGGAA